MTVKIASAGSSETSDTSPYSDGGTSNGTVTSSTSFAHNQSHSVKCTANTGGTGRKASFGYTSGIQDAGARISFGLTVDAYPSGFGSTSANRDRILYSLTAGNTTCWNLSLDTTGKLRFLDSLFASQATGTTVLTKNVRYRIGLAYTITSSSVNSFKVYINGVLEFSVNNITTVVSGVKPEFGPTDWDATSSAASCYFTDIFVDNISDLTDTGDVQVAAFRPFANGTANNFTTQIGAGGSGYGSGHAPQVNELPLSQTNGWSMIGAGSAITEEYNIESISGGATNLTNMTILGVVGWVYAKAATSETGNIIVDGTSTNIALTTTATFFPQVSPNPTTFPAGTGTDIGIITSTTVTTVSLYECGIVVAYILPTNTNFQFPSPSNSRYAGPAVQRFLAGMQPMFPPPSYDLAPIVDNNYQYPAQQKNKYNGPPALRRQQFQFWQTMPSYQINVDTIGTATLSLTEFQITVNLNKISTPPTKALILTEFPPTVSAPRVATINTKALTLTEYQITAATPRVSTIGKISLVLSEFIPTVNVGANSTPSTRALVITKYQITAAAPRVSTVSTLALTLTPYQVVLGDFTATVSTAHLVITTHIPITSALSPIGTTVRRPLYSPDRVRVNMYSAATPRRTLISSRHGAVPQSETVGVHTLTITTYAPKVAKGIRSTVGTKALTITTYAPTYAILNNTHYLFPTYPKRRPLGIGAPALRFVIRPRSH